jgi:LPS export ABC transporter permease LptF
VHAAPFRVSLPHPRLLRRVPLRTLHFYVTRQVLAALVLTVLVFAFVLLLGNVLREVLALIISGQATPALVGKALLLLLPFVLVFALPMGMLTATLLVFGRLSADQELTAARAGGISLVSLATPVFLLGAAASCLSAWINFEVAPRCRTAYRELFQRTALEQAASFIQAGQYLEFEGGVLYVRSKTDARLENVLIYELTPDSKMKRLLRAAWAEILTDQANVEAVLRLHSVSYYDFEQFHSGTIQQLDSFRVNYRRRDAGPTRSRIRDMTLHDLRQALREIEALEFLMPPGPEATSAQLREHRTRLQRVRAELASPLRVQIHRQVAFSFACLGFTLIGVPLGVRAHRRETSAGIALALVLVILYYGFVILAQSLQDDPRYGPHLILWIPNLLFQVAGGVLLWRANHGV